jgi:GNAT superfamily N-acetyltransferase
MPTVRVRRTHLALPDRAALRPPTGAPPARARVERLTPSCPVPLYRALYRAVGDRWHWRDRDTWSDDRLQAWLDDPRVSVLVVRDPDVVSSSTELDDIAGYAELARLDDGGVEIAYFGLVAEAMGRGLGGFLLARAVEEAWAMGAGRVVLHTCTLDAPQALPNYLARGFQPIGEEWYDAELPDSLGG